MAASASARTRRPAPRTRVRWDRLGRAGMLAVLCVLLYLTITPLLRLLSTEHQAARARAQITALERSNAALRAQRAALMAPGSLEPSARRLGMIRPGERGYVVTGLPAN